ncbi:sensory neuron membrane protein 1-like [Dermatophagoides pteronyssinus]|uniref:sensory neuron membrane protein 1-like n=1 Tax=Dermatophagoides pteronyssinus TaxID=6956 RepID=UPI003F66A4F8
MNNSTTELKSNTTLPIYTIPAIDNDNEELLIISPEQFKLLNLHQQQQQHCIRRFQSEPQIPYKQYHHGNIHTSPIISNNLFKRNESIIIRPSTLITHSTKQQRSPLLLPKRPLPPPPPPTITPPPPPYQTLYDNKKPEKKSKKLLMDNDDSNESKNNINRFYLRLGIIILFVSILNWFLFIPIRDFLLNSQFQLNPDNMLLRIGFYNAPIPVQADLYFFELRNGEQFLEGTPANLREIGPFVFNVDRKREILSWTDHTVIFREKFFATFDQERSPFSINTRMQTVNVPIVASLGWTNYWLDKFKIRFIYPITQHAIHIVMRTFGENLLEEIPISEVLFGRKISIVTVFDSLAASLRLFHIPFPDYTILWKSFGNYEIVNSSFGVMDLFMGHWFGPLEHYRFNRPGHHKMNEVRSILGSRHYENYASPCNLIKGLDIFHFGLHDQGQSFEIYFQHFCRRIKFIRKGFHWNNGFRTVRYEVWPFLFNMHLVENRCYCFGDRKLKECDGYTDLAGCFGGLALAFSFPHFVGSPHLNHDVYGLRPQWSEHGSFIELEPTLGIPVHAKISFQFNFILRDLPRFGPLSKLHECIMPYARVTVQAKADGWLHILLIIMSSFLNNGRIVITLITIIISILCFILTLYRQNQSTTTTTTIIKPGKKVVGKKTKIDRSKNLEYRNHMKMKPKQSRHHQQIQPIMIALP